MESVILSLETVVFRSFDPVISFATILKEQRIRFDRTGLCQPWECRSFPCAGM